MKLYTYKPEFLEQKYEFWTGHISDSFNKCFRFYQIRDMIIPLSDVNGEIIDKANSINPANKDEINELLKLSRGQHVFEFNDLWLQRYLIPLIPCRLKLFEKEKDEDIYYEYLDKATKHNNDIHREMIEFLFEQNAYEGFLNHHVGRSNLLSLIEKTVTGEIK